MTTQETVLEEITIDACPGCKAILSPGSLESLLHTARGCTGYRTDYSAEMRELNALGAGERAEVEGDWSDAERPASVRRCHRCTKPIGRGVEGYVPEGDGSFSHGTCYAADMQRKNVAGETRVTLTGLGWLVATEVK